FYYFLATHTHHCSPYPPSTSTTLFRSGLGDGLARQPGELRGVVGLTPLLRAEKRDQGVGPRQAPDVSGEDAIGAPLHAVSPGGADRKSTRLNSTTRSSLMPSSA